MAPITPGTNCLTQAEDSVVELFANLASFQAFAGVGDALSAKQRIYVHDIPGTLTDDSDTWDAAEWLAMFPVALVKEPEDAPMWDIVQAARDRLIQYNINLAFEVTLEAYPADGLDDQEQARAFMNAYGAIVEELHTVANLRPGEFAPSRISPSGKLGRRHYAKHADLGDVFFHSILLERVVEPV